MVGAGAAMWGRRDDGGEARRFFVVRRGAWREPWSASILSKIRRTAARGRESARRRCGVGQWKMREREERKRERHEEMGAGRGGGGDVGDSEALDYKILNH